MDISKYIKNNHLKILVKPNAKKTQLMYYVADREAVRIDVKAKPEDNEANIEIVKFFSKLLKKKVLIKTGLKSKEKLLLIQ